MATKTVDILMNLQTKTEGIDSLSKGFKEAEKEAEKLRKEIERLKFIGATTEAKRLEGQLKKTKQEMERISKEANKRALEKSMIAANQRMTETIGKLEKVSAAAMKIGSSMQLMGAAILAPLILAAKKYVDVAGETEDTSRRIVELNKQWTDAQFRLGRVVATEVLPHLEKAMGYLDKAIAYAEANPGVISGALTIGASLVALGTLVKVVGGIIGTVSAALKIAQTLGIVASASSAAGGAVATGGAAAAAGGGLAAGLAAIGTGIAALPALILGSPLLLAVFTAAVLAGTAALTLAAINWFTGSDVKWSDLLLTVKQLAVMTAEGWDIMFKFFGAETNFSGALSTLLNTSDLNIGKNFNTTIVTATTSLIQTFSTWMSKVATTISNTAAGIVISIQNMASSVVSGISSKLSELSDSIFNGISELGDSIVEVVSSIIDLIPGLATGGYATGKIYKVGEQGKEFVMNNNSTRAAESLIGGSLTQQNLLSALARGGGNRSMTVNDNRRFNGNIPASVRREIANEAMNGFAQVLNGR